MKERRHGTEESPGGFSGHKLEKDFLKMIVVTEWVTRVPYSKQYVIHPIYFQWPISG